ncbi:MAG TPA: hypothetical protein ACFYEF_12225 [Candidatus Wunengus sp. YC63]
MKKQAPSLYKALTTAGSDIGGAGIQAEIKQLHPWVNFIEGEFGV